MDAQKLILNSLTREPQVGLAGASFILFQLPYQRVFHVPYLDDVDTGEVRREFVLPVARGRLTEFFYLDGKVVNYEELRMVPGFNGTNNYLNVFEIELWDDCGEDGHLLYRLRGYACVLVNFRDGNPFPYLYTDFINAYMVKDFND